jgi:hypothetical protein
MDIDRYRDQMDPDIPECTIALIDSLSAYVRVMKGVTDDRQDPPDSALRSHVADCAKLLEDLKGWQLDVTLQGLIRKRSGGAA